MYCVQCRCETWLGRQVDALVFARPEDQAKHLKMCRAIHLQEFLAEVVEEVPAAEFTCAGLKGGRRRCRSEGSSLHDQLLLDGVGSGRSAAVSSRAREGAGCHRSQRHRTRRDTLSGVQMRVPAFVLTATSVPVEAFLQTLADSPTALRTAAMHALAQQLLVALAQLHKHRLVHRSVTRSNVTRVEAPSARASNVSWAFREVCRYTRAGRKVSTEALTREEALTLPPEVCLPADSPLARWGNAC